MTIDISPVPVRPSRRGDLRGLGDAALTGAAVLGALSLVAALVLAVAGMTPLVFTSGSMGPEIPTGSLALARSVPVDELAVGDVVSVLDPQGTRVTHRVVAIDDTGLTLKGDANLSADPGTYDVAAADRVLWSVPRAGTVVARATAPLGRGVLLGVAAMALLALVWPRSGARPSRSEAVAVLAALAAVAGVGVGLGPAPEGTSAFWTDAVSATSQVSVARAAPVPEKPVLTGCTRTGKGASLTWTSATDPASFQIRYENPTIEALLDGALRQSSTQSANLNNSTGEVWVVAIRDGLESESNHYRYSGNGSGASCVPVR